MRTVTLSLALLALAACQTVQTEQDPPRPAGMSEAAAQAQAQGEAGARNAQREAAWTFEVIRVEHANAKQLAGPLSGLMRGNARILSDARTNSLLVHTSSETLAELKDLIAQLDVAID